MKRGLDEVELLVQLGGRNLGDVDVCAQDVSASGEGKKGRKGGREANEAKGRTSKGNEKDGTHGPKCANRSHAQPCSA